MSGNEHPATWALLVDYWAGDLDPSQLDELELHLLGCDHCSALSAQVAALTESLRQLYPPLLTAARLQELKARGVAIVENPMLPGERREVVFPADATILLHRLGGLSLADATRVSFVMRVEHSGDELVRIDDAPYDAAHGQVLVACQQAFSIMPPNTVAEIDIHRADGQVQRATYTILHLFAADGG